MHGAQLSRRRSSADALSELGYEADTGSFVELREEEEEDSDEEQPIPPINDVRERATEAGPSTPMEAPSPPDSRTIDISPVAYTSDALSTKLMYVHSAHADVKLSVEQVSDGSPRSVQATLEIDWAGTGAGAAPSLGPDVCSSSSRIFATGSKQPRSVCQVIAAYLGSATVFLSLLSLIWL